MTKTTATLNTAEKVLRFVEKQKKPTTPTTIHKETGVCYNSVLSSLEKLEKWGQVTLVSNGRFILVSRGEK